MNTPETITFVSQHYYPSSRRAGFHNLADAAHGMGFKVNFVTAAYSFMSYARRDYRTRIPGIRGNLNTLVEIRPGLYSYVYFTPWHPMTLLLPFLNKISMPWMDAYGRGDLGALLPLVRQTDVFVFESTPGLFLFRRFLREQPAAKTIYRVSDDIRILGSTHPRLVELEREIAPLFDSVSVPSSWMLDMFPDLPSLRLDRHGLDKNIYDNCVDSPYESGTRNAVFVGTGYMDLEFITAAAKGNQDCFFHVIGPVAAGVKLRNVRFHGEMPFIQTVPYVKFADVGLACRTFRKGFAASLTDSLKIIQYRYCGLPIVSPDFIDLKRDGVFYYRPGDAGSASSALRDALASGREPERASEVRTWEEVFADILSASLPGLDFRQRCV